MVADTCFLAGGGEHFKDAFSQRKVSIQQYFDKYFSLQGNNYRSIIPESDLSQILPFRKLDAKEADTVMVRGRPTDTLRHLIKLGASSYCEEVSPQFILLAC